MTRETKEAPANAPAGAPPSRLRGASQHLTAGASIPRYALSTLKRDVHLPRVLEMLGRPVERTADNSWRAHCLNPDHADEHPSMGLFHGFAGWKLYCHVCGWSGDLFDALRLLGRAESFNDAYAEACRLAAEGLDPSVQGDGSESFSPPPAPSRPLNVETINRAMCEAGRAEDLVERWLVDHKGLDVDPAWLVSEFDLGATRKGSLLLPYRAGGSKEILGASRRWRQDGVWRKADLAGSRHRSLGVLYGEWRDRGSTWTVLVEGESDCLAVAHWLRSPDPLRGRDVIVLGIPGASVSPSPAAVERLTGGRVILLLDADPAGEAARARWREALAPHASVYDARLPEGLDAVDAGRKAVLRAVADAVKARQETKEKRDV